MRDFTGGTSGPVDPNNPGNGTPNGNPPGGGGPGNPGGVPIIVAPTKDTPGNIDPLEMLVNYNEKFANAGPIMFREEVTRQMQAILIGKNKPNCLLIGPAGVGKTKIAEDLAWRIVNNDPTLPDKLKKAVVYELPLFNIVSGSRYTGDLEEKLKAVVNFISDPDNNAIVFIDEIHVLVESQDGQAYDKIAQILKPSLARGDFRTIGATTVQEATKFMNDPALNRRFSRVIVDEFTNEQTIEILKSMRNGFTAHYDSKVAMTDDLFETVVRLANEYSAAGSHRPDSAITLLDRACGEAVISRKVQEDMARNDPVILAAIKSQPIIQVTTRQIKRTAIKMMTGNAKKNDFDIDKTRTLLKSQLFGQDDVIERVLKLIRQYDLDLFPKKKPMTIMFAGDSGVGKTEMTKIVAQALTGVKPIILNMPEYDSSASINRIIGSPAGYVGHESSRELPFDALEANPYQIILLDEFEKSDRAVQRLFMSAFDEGYFTTHYGKIVDFSRSIIIATTNAGHTNKKSSIGFDATDGVKTKTDSIRTLKRDFDTELLNRFRDIIEFHPLDKATYRNIVASKYHREVERILQDNPLLSLPADIPDADLDEIVERTYLPEFGARPAERSVQEYIESNV